MASKLNKPSVVIIIPMFNEEVGASPCVDQVMEVNALREKLAKITEAVASLWEVSKKIEDREIQHEMQSILSRIKT